MSSKEKNTNKILVKSKIVYIRNSLGISQDEFADKIGVARSTYAYYENSSEEMPYEILMKIANELKVRDTLLAPKDYKNRTITLASNHRKNHSKIEDTSEPQNINVNKNLDFDNEEVRQQLLKTVRPLDDVNEKTETKIQEQIDITLHSKHSTISSNNDVDPNDKTLFNLFQKLKEDDKQEMIEKISSILQNY